MYASTPNAVEYAGPRLSAGRAWEDRPIGARWIWLAAALGIFCRLAQYGARRSWWIDEASLVLNIRARGPAALLGHLDYAQAAPPMFLLIERGLWRALGPGELSLRLLPLAAGIISVLLFARLARRALPSPWDAVATLLFALSDRLIYHDTELKPYGMDVMFAVLLLLIALDVTGTRAAARRVVWAGIATAIAVWFSFPSMLVFGAISLALLPGILRGRKTGWIGYVAVNLLVLASFAAVLYLTRENRGDSTLVDYWQDSFFDWKRPWSIPYFILRRLTGAADYPFPATGPVTLAAAALGAYVLLRERKFEMLALLAGPVLIVILAAAVHRYPFDGARLTVFLTPGLLILAILGFRWMIVEFFPKIRFAAFVPLGYLLVTVLYWSIYHLIEPRNRSHMGPVAAYVGQHVGPNDTIYVFDLRPFECYWPADDAARLRMHLDRADEIPTSSFWIVWPTNNEKMRAQTGQSVAWLRQFCREDANFSNDGDAAIHFQRIAGRAPADPVPPYRGPEYEPHKGER